MTTTPTTKKLTLKKITLSALNDEEASNIQNVVAITPFMTVAFCTPPPPPSPEPGGPIQTGIGYTSHCSS